MNIEQTEEYKKLCEMYGVRKLGCNRAGEPCYYGSKKWKKCATFGMECKESEFNYYQFTPQKQLELIKLIGNSGRFEYEESYFDGEEECLCIAVINCTHYDASGDDFDIALVKLLTKLKNNLNHTKVKEILEG